MGEKKGTGKSTGADGILTHNPASSGTKGSKNGTGDNPTPNTETPVNKGVSGDDNTLGASGGMEYTADLKAVAHHL